MSKPQDPVEMDLNLMRPSEAQRRPFIGEASLQVEVPLTLEERSQIFGSHCLGFVGAAAHVLDKLRR